LLMIYGIQQFMAKKKTKKVKHKKARRWLRRGSVCFVLLMCLPVYAVVLFAFFNPSAGFYMGSEARRLGGVKQQWTALSDFSPVMARSVVAAEDANFCTHHGFDLDAIRDAIEGGGQRGASTISQQVSKNVFLWHGRSYLRKGLEAGFTVLIELIWTKERIVEVYLNVAEFDEGVFGAAAGARHYFGVAPDRITNTQAGRLAAILPNPKNRSASRPSNFVRKRTRAIISGAGTIDADGRADCFQGG
jgi:monofunctional biosynthetic peptidoglycan transglycosylase